MLTRFNRVDDVFDFQRAVDRVFNEFWSDLPTLHRNHERRLNVVPCECHRRRLAH